VLIMRTRTVALLAVSAVIGLAGCTSTARPSSVAKDKSLANQQLSRLSTAQPAPEFPYSQIRQNLIEIDTAQANAVQTTSFFFNFAQDPIASCPSIGYPIASTTQLTNPLQEIDHGSYGQAVVAQKAKGS
jgi:hypothetical protein